MPNPKPNPDQACSSSWEATALAPTPPSCRTSCAMPRRPRRPHCRHPGVGNYRGTAAVAMASGLAAAMAAALAGRATSAAATPITVYGSAAVLTAATTAAAITTAVGSAVRVAASAASAVAVAAAYVPGVGSRAAVATAAPPPGQRIGPTHLTAPLTTGGRVCSHCT